MYLNHAKIVDEYDIQHTQLCTHTVLLFYTSYTSVHDILFFHSFNPLSATDAIVTLLYLISYYPTPAWFEPKTSLYSVNTLREICTVVIDCLVLLHFILKLETCADKFYVTFLRVINFYSLQSLTPLFLTHTFRCLTDGIRTEDIPLFQNKIT